VSRRDEIGELAGAVDDMARQLEARAEETAELAANVCHELKSPLTGLRGAAELLAGGEVTDPVDRRRFLDNIVADVDRLDALVTRLLELSRVSADGEPWELVDLREPVAAGARLAAVDLELGPRPIPVRGRPGHLASAVRNLVENALVHREPGSRVAVALAARRGVAAVEVINRGSPIPAAIAAKIWGRFYTTRGADGGTGLGLPIVAAVEVINRGSPIPAAIAAKIWGRFYTTRGADGGTGLGLPIVAAVARAHGGEARLASSTAGATTFAIELPIATPLSRSR
jgi:signal transduction histidine kinase